MIRRRRTSLLKIVVLLFVLLGCNLESRKSPAHPEPFTFKYIESGGIMGMYNVLAFTANDSLVYEGRHYHVARALSAGERQSLITLLDTRHFFNMDSTYLPPGGIADDDYYTLHYESPSTSKVVKASGSCGTISKGCSWPDGFGSIVDFMRKRVTQLKEETTTGCVKIHSTYRVSPWPYEGQVVLGNSLYKTVAISNAIIRSLQSAQDATPQIQFYENDWIYRLDFNVHDVSLSINDRIHPVHWPIVPALADIPAQGIVIKGNNYVWLDSVFTHPHYPRYFMDKKLADGNPAYVLDFVRGNTCQ